MGTYSFLDVVAAITGQGGAIPLGNSAGVAEEGISVSMSDEKNTLTLGADGSAMNSLHGANAGKVTVRLLKTSTVNAALSALYNFQKGSSANWGQNTIVISDVARGDLISCTGCAFAKQPDLTYAKDGGMNEWEFHAGSINQLLGTGQLDNNS